MKLKAGVCRVKADSVFQDEYPMTAAGQFPAETETTSGRSSQMDQIHASPQALVSIITGVLILILPRLLNYIVALYLILVGVLSILRF